MSPNNRNEKRRVGRFALAAALVAALGAPVSAQAPNMTPDVEIDQATVMSGGYTFRKIAESGRHFFSIPFNRFDGHGEGPNGPRRSTQQLYDAPGFGFLRLNGLDAQSCFECHDTAGFEHLGDTLSSALARKPGSVGGPAGFASNAFINPNFPSALTTFIRNPPHVFGLGYVQQLAEEMSLELMAQRAAARVTAMGTPDVEVAQPLSSKGTDFGTYRVTFSTARAGDSRPGLEQAVLGWLDDPKGARGGAFVEDLAGVEGVSEDFVVRPFQWKGIASNERNFEKDALNFHFSIQAEELFYEEDAGNPGTIIIADPDNDQDGVENEMGPGNVTAISVFTLSMRPPNQVIPEGQEAVVARGRSIFTGEATDVVPMGALSCSGCHTPSLRINSTLATTLDPTDISNLATRVGSPVGLSTQIASSAQLPVARRFRNIVGEFGEEQLRSPANFASEVVLSAKRGGGPLVGYHFDLQEMDSMPLSFPRLPGNMDGTVDVPLFSDLRRHDMGEGLQDVAAQGTDVAGIEVAPRLFLTRPLWGVGNGNPWLHDGRATTLVDAILLHESNGSEANETIQNFRAMSQEDQDAVVSFLLTLQLPIERSYDLSRGQSSLIVQ